MTGKDIRILADHVVNQIAAGEVVERPASVVKELIENSLDAGAKRISIEIVDGGKSLVRVVDDGSGMSLSEMKLALTRHATSKLRSAEDLFSLETMGFRGEALPSIAAVSKLTMTSRRRSDTHPAAWELSVGGGQSAGEREVGAPVGTSVSVRDLLFNLPARQKFMKGDATELSHVADCVARLALANRSVHFRLRHKGRTLLDAPVAPSELDRARAVLGAKAQGDSLICAEGDGGGVQVRALLGNPSGSQKSARGVQLFVGRRWIRDRGLLHAVVSGYGEALGAGRYPRAVVFIDAPAGSVDVNVHPQKHEVRFADPQVVYAVVKGVIERAAAAFAQPVQNEPETMRPMAAVASGSGPTRAAERLASYAASRRLFAPAAMVPRTLTRSPRPPSQRPSSAAATPKSDEPAADGFFATLRYLGTLDEQLWVCEGGGELVLIDAAVARERICRADICRQLESTGVPAQRLMFPQALELSREAQPLAQARRNELAELGFEIGPDTSEATELLSVPCGIAGGRGSALVDELVLASDLNERTLILARELGREQGREQGRELSPVSDPAYVASCLVRLDLDGARQGCESDRHRALCLSASVDQLRALLSPRT